MAWAFLAFNVAAVGGVLAWVWWATLLRAVGRLLGWRHAKDDPDYSFDPEMAGGGAVGLLGGYYPHGGGVRRRGWGIGARHLSCELKSSRGAVG